MDNRQFDWVIILERTNWHAKGLKVCKKIYDRDYEANYLYKYGEWIVSDEDMQKEWLLNSFSLDWVDLEQDYKPTWKDKLRKFFLHKGYPLKTIVRPKDENLVIARYGTEKDAYYEMVEYNNKSWITDLSFPVLPTSWAYVPKECIEEAELLNGKIQEIWHG